MTKEADPAAELRDFLLSRRARLNPEQAGLAHWGRRRRVAGLRREEVAQLAGISAEYYTRIERGRITGLSPSVFESLSAALQLDQVESDHLAQLIQAVISAPARQTPQPAPTTVPLSLHQLLEATTGAAAFIRNERLDILAANTLARALYEALFDNPANQDNLARFVFLDPRSRSFYRDWNGIALDAAGSLRVLSARSPQDPELRRLVHDLATHSTDFQSRWDDHSVRSYRHGQQAFHHPRAGSLDLDYDALAPLEAPGLVVIAYTSRDTHLGALVEGPA